MSVNLGGEEYDERVKKNIEVYKKTRGYRVVMATGNYDKKPGCKNKVRKRPLLKFL